MLSLEIWMRLRYFEKKKRIPGTWRQGRNGKIVSFISVPYQVI